MFCVLLSAYFDKARTASVLNGIRNDPLFVKSYFVKVKAKFAYILNVEKPTTNNLA